MTRQTTGFSNRSRSTNNFHFFTFLSILFLTIFLIYPCYEGHCSQVTLTWDPNSETDLVGYDIYYGTASGNYQWKTDVGNVTTYTQTGLDIGATYYFAATAHNIQGLESAFSNEVVYAAPGCTYTLSPSSASFSTIGGSGSVLVTTQAGCNWSTSAAASWVTINSGSGTGSGTMTYTVGSNTGITERVSSLTVAGNIFTITEAGLTAYTITASAGTGGSISPSGAVSVQSGGSQTFTISPNSGYSVTGVTVDGASVGAVTTYTFTNVAANHTMAATFTATTYTITATAGSNGSITPSGSVFVNSGGNRTFTIAANSGYSISNVTVDGLSQGAMSSYTFSNVTAAHTIAATFLANTYTITASAGTGGTITPSGSISVNSGGSQTFTITPNSGYSVSGVTVDGSSVGPVTTYTFSNVAANHTIAATFTATTYTITATAGTGGTISPSGSVSVNSVGSRIFTITVNSGYSISNVTVDGVSQGAVSSFTFSNVTAAHTIAATFLTNTYTITASAGTGGTITPSGSISVNSGGSQTFTITPNTGYSISVVTVDGASVGAVTTYTITNVTANHIIAVTFIGTSGPPLVSTDSATSITRSSATLNGTVNPKGLSTTYTFQWGRTSSYGSTTTVKSAGSGMSNVSASANITGLRYNTVYHYRIVATDSAGTTYGSDKTFNTKKLW